MQRFIRFLIGLIGSALLVGLAFFIDSFGIFAELDNNLRLALVIGVGILGFALAAKMESVPLTDVIFGTIGLFIALIIANLVTTPIVQLSVSYLGNFLGVAISVIIYIVLGLLGIRIAVKSKDEVMTWIQGLREDMTNKSTRVGVDKKQARVNKKKTNKENHGHDSGDEDFLEMPKIKKTNNS